MGVIVIVLLMIYASETVWSILDVQWPVGNIATISNNVSCMDSSFELVEFNVNSAQFAGKENTKKGIYGKKMKGIGLIGKKYVRCTSE